MASLPRARVAVAALLVALAVVGALPGAAAADPPAPPPTPPPTTAPAPPPDGGSTAAQAAEVGSLVGKLSTLQSHLDDLADQVGDRQELANKAVADDAAARTRVEQTRRDADAARASADDVAARAQDARTAVDTWVAAQYQQADASSVAAALAGSNGPADVAERLQLQSLITSEQAADLENYERARVDAANADSRARAAAAQAADAAAAAGRARDAAAAELDRARSAVAAQRQEIAGVTAQRDAAQQRLDALTARDAALAAQRQRAEAAQAEAAQQAAASDQAAKAAAQARLAREAPSVTVPDPGGSGSPTGTGSSGTGGTAGSSGTGGTVGSSGTPTTTPDPGATGDGGAAPPVTGGEPAPANPVEVVIDRALSELGTSYSWGGGNANGPTKGIHDGGEADAFGDFDKVGFDCSGLMVYAFAGAGITLPHYSGYQIDAGPKVPLAQRRPGDMMFWADKAEGVHHVALYLGDDRMIEAPNSGSVVRIVPVRFDDEIVPTVTRPLP